MASLIDILEGNTPIRSPLDKFYNYFKYNLTDLVKVFPIGFTGFKLIEGIAGIAGSIYSVNYVLGGIPLSAKISTDPIDDDAKSMTVNVLEGDLLQLYKTFKVTLNVSEGLAKWTFTYEKRTLLTPPPELYVPFVITMSTLVDAYLLNN